MKSPRSPRRLLGGLTAIALLGALSALVALCGEGLAQGLPFLAPLLLLLAVLTLRRYPGERALSRLRARGLAQPRRAADPGGSPRRPCAPRAHLPRGGRLIAFSLAVRPPPVLSAVALS